MSSEHFRESLGTVKDKFSELDISKKEGQDAHRNSKPEKTAADYIHENEMRLRTYSMPTQNTLVKPNRLKHSFANLNVASYVFEKVKPKTVSSLANYDVRGINTNEEESLSNENTLFPGEIRPRTSSMPAQNTYKKPEKRAIQRSQLNLNTLGAFADKPLNMRKTSSKCDFYKQKTANSGLEEFFEEEMRTRTSSMPTRSMFSKPRISHLRLSHQDLFTKPELEMHSVRLFELNSKGKIVKRSESRSTRSSNSEHSLEDDFYLICKDLSRRSSVTQMDEFKVFVKGITGVGKTALMQQFLTTQYLGGFDTSYDGETEKTVNVLLNGEETVLAFKEVTEVAEDEVVDETDANVAAYLIVYASDDRASFDRAVDILYNLRQKQLQSDVIFLVGNKSDLVRSRCVTTGEAKAVAMTYDCKFVETSVVINVNVDELLVGIVKQLRLRSTTHVNDKSTGCASSSKSLLNKIFKKHNLSKSCENLYA